MFGRTPRARFRLIELPGDGFRCLLKLRRRRRLKQSGQPGQQGVKARTNRENASAAMGAEPGARLSAAFCRPRVAISRASPGSPARPMTPCPTPTPADFATSATEFSVESPNDGKAEVSAGQDTWLGAAGSSAGAPAAACSANIFGMPPRRPPSPLNGKWLGAGAGSVSWKRPDASGKIGGAKATAETARRDGRPVGGRTGPSAGGRWRIRNSTGLDAGVGGRVGLGDMAGGGFQSFG